MSTGRIASAVLFCLLAGCGRETVPPAAPEPRCGQVMNAPDKHSKADVERCRDKGFERTDRKGGY